MNHKYSPYDKTYAYNINILEKIDRKHHFVTTCDVSFSEMGQNSQNKVFPKYYKYFSYIDPKYSLNRQN